MNPACPRSIQSCTLSIASGSRVRSSLACSPTVGAISAPVPTRAPRKAIAIAAAPRPRGTRQRSSMSTPFSRASPKRTPRKTAKTR
jgi:hypothetical protein